MERAEQATGPVAPRAAAEPDRPRSLTIAAVSDDRRTLHLVDATGASYTLPVTPALRAALRGDASRPGQLEIPMDSALRPRDIQARIRAGETAEAVAQAAQTSVEKIMPFVAPVLAEREHVAERAQRSTVRRPAGESAAPGGRTLGDAVASHLRALNVDPEGVEWDAWRREDGRWTLSAGYALPARAGTGHFTYDARGNYVVLDDEDARWLVGEVVATPPAARDDLQSVRERRLSTVPHDELPLGDDAIELVADSPAEPPASPAASPVDAFLDTTPEADDPALREEAAEAAAAEPEPVLPEEPKRRPAPKKRGRASVPSWDEIMFGPGSE